MYNYGGTLYKKHGSLKGQLMRKPKVELPLVEETSFLGDKLVKSDKDIERNKENTRNLK